MQYLFHKKRTYFPILSLSVLFLLLLSGCSRQQEYTQSGFYFDTVISLSVYDKDADHAKDVLDGALQLCETYDDLLNESKEGSDIYRINHAQGDYTSVSSETVSLLYTALQYCAVSDGHLDITIAPVKALWTFDPESGNAYVPASSTIEQALTHVDYHMVEIDGNKVRLSDPDAGIDLGFIAKGYIADQLKAYLLSQHIESGIINLGGNVLTIGQKPDGSAFTVGIQEPFAKQGKSITTVSAADSKGDTFASVVTTGIYERYFELNGEIYHHILDAKTGYPIRNNLSSVTILTDSSVQADALSTTCMILGLDDARELISSLNGEAQAIFITNDGEIIDTRN